MPTPTEQLLTLAAAARGQQQPEGTVQATINPNIPQSSAGTQVAGLQTVQPTATQVPGLQTIQPNQGVVPGKQDEEQAVYKTITNDDTGKSIVVFAEGGKPQPVSQLKQAASNFIMAGQQTPGYKVMDDSVFSTIRKGYEAINVPVQAAAGKLDDPQSRVNMLPDMLQGPVKSLLRLPSESIKTPEQLGATAGMVGANMLLPGVSMPLQITGGVGGAIGGSMLGQALTGEKVDVGKSMTSGLLAALGQGVTGVVKWGLGQGMSKKAGEDTAAKIMDYLKEQHGNLATDPNILNMASSSRDLSKIVQITMKGLRDDVTSMSRQTALNTLDMFTGKLSADLQNTYRAQMRRIAEASNSFLENVNNTKALNKAKQTIADATDNIASLVNEAFKDSDPKVKAQVAQSIYGSVASHVNNLKDMSGTAEVFRALERSSAKSGGWNIRNFQDEIKSYYEQNPDSHLAAVGDIASRGAGLHGGIDRTMLDPHAVPSWVIGGFNTPAMGRRYIGKVESHLARGATAAGNVAGSSFFENALGGKDAIKNFIGEDKK